jgi:hypothetical protein
MFSVPAVPAVERARWLAELADALDEAHRLVFELGIVDAAAPPAIELHLRIEAARMTVQSLRQSRAAERRVEYSPQWSSLVPWPAARAET